MYSATRFGEFAPGGSDTGGGGIALSNRCAEGEAFAQALPDDPIRQRFNRNVAADIVDVIDATLKHSTRDPETLYAWNGLAVGTDSLKLR